MKKLANKRINYHFDKLHTETLDKDPFQQFREWFQVVLDSDIFEPNAMALATADQAGKPSMRMVLLKSFDEDGFVFFTNYESRKGRDLSKNKSVALLFWWEFMQRQVRIEGRVEKISAAESDAYFSTRPRDSQISAWASSQSHPLDDRQVLEQKVADLKRRFEGKTVVRPEYWGGYRITPDVFEFWQGRTNRLHDRFRYEKRNRGQWHIQRLYP